jgi:hypothetical protein
MTDRNWFKRNAEAILVGLVVCAVWAGIGFLYSLGHPWAAPIFYGLVAATFVLAGGPAFNLIGVAYKAGAPLFA